jgi:hypothetical protein
LPQSSAQWQFAASLVVGALAGGRSGSYAFVSVMKAAHFWEGYHRAQLWYRNGSWLWCILPQR